jgi:hypothetical protein
MNHKELSESMSIQDILKIIRFKANKIEKQREDLYSAADKVHEILGETNPIAINLDDEAAAISQKCEAFTCVIRGLDYLIFDTHIFKAAAEEGQNPKKCFWVYKTEKSHVEIIHASGFGTYLVDDPITYPLAGPMTEYEARMAVNKSFTRLLPHH